MVSQGSLLAPKDAPMRPQVTEDGPHASQIWVRMIPLGGGVGGGAASGQWASDGADDFSKFFWPSVLKPTRERRPSKENMKTKRAF